MHRACLWVKSKQPVLHLVTTRAPVLPDASLKVNSQNNIFNMQHFLGMYCDYFSNSLSNASLD